jgi:hypothetical protein
MADRDLTGLCWSIVLYYMALMLAVLAVHPPGRTGGSIGDAIATAAGTPLLFVLLFFGGLSVINFWMALGVAAAILAGLAVAVARLRGKLRIAAVLALLTAMNLYAGYIGARVGA